MIKALQKKNSFIFSILMLCLILITGCDNINFGGDIKTLIEPNLTSKVTFYESIEPEAPFQEMTYNIGEVIYQHSFPQYTRDEYLLAGWNLMPDYRNSDPTAFTYDYKAHITSMRVLPEAVSIYAMWVKKCYISFVTDCDQTIDTVVVPYGDCVNQDDYLRWCEITKEGYHFKGWYLEPECLNEFNSFSIITGDITLYAKWAPVINVTYHSNDGTDRIHVGASEEYQISMHWCSDYHWEEREGYGFIGWARDASASTPDYYYGDTIEDITECLDLYAVWTTDLVSITYYDTEDSTRTLTVHYGRGAHLLIGRYFTTDGTREIRWTWTRTGRQIKGFDFSSSADINNLSYTPYGDYALGGNDPFRTEGILEDKTIYVYWTAKVYKLSFYYDDGTGNGTFRQYGSEQDVEWNTTATCPSVPPEIPGYTFEGWYNRYWDGMFMTYAFSPTPFDFTTVFNEQNFGENAIYVSLYAKYTPSQTEGGHFTFTVLPMSDIYVSRIVIGNTATFTADEDYDSYEWYLNGIKLTAYNNQNSVSFDMSSWANGIHDLMLIVSKDSDVFSYYAQITKY